MTKFKQFLVSIQNLLVIKYVTFRLNNFLNKKNFTRLGTYYGGWWISNQILENARLVGGTCISCGIGNDVSFDEAMLRNNFKIIALDPLKDSCNYANVQLSIYKNKEILNLGIWTRSGGISFNAPKIKEHNSWSITNSHKGNIEEKVSFQCITLKELIKLSRIDSSMPNLILKMDIEGAELELLNDIASLEVKFDMLCIELDCLSLIPFLNFKSRFRNSVKVRKEIHKLKSSGYQLVLVENFNFFWTRKI